MTFSLGYMIAFFELSMKKTTSIIILSLFSIILIIAVVFLSTNKNKEANASISGTIITMPDLGGTSQVRTLNNAFDRDNGILYVSEIRGDQDNQRPIIHVWRMRK